MRLHLLRLLWSIASFNASFLMCLLLMRLAMRLINAYFGSAGTVSETVAYWNLHIEKHELESLCCWFTQLVGSNLPC